VHLLASTIARSQKPISGLLLGCIDIHVKVPRVEHETLTDRSASERSAMQRLQLSARAFH
jgi:predicted ATPase with chaperone activity